MNVFRFSRETEFWNCKGRQQIILKTIEMIYAAPIMRKELKLRAIERAKYSNVMPKNAEVERLREILESE